MTRFTLASFIFFIFTSLASQAQNEYTFAITVNSLEEQEHPFELEIISIENDKEVSSQYMTGLVTPLSMVLEPGQYKVRIHHNLGDDVLELKGQGIKNADKKGWAKATYEKTELKLGPGGNYGSGSFE